MGPKIGPRNRSKICLGGPGATQGRRRLPRGLQGAILEPFGTHFGAILGAMLGRFGNNFRIYFKPRRPATTATTASQFPSFSGSAGARVSAYNFHTFWDDFGTPNGTHIGIQNRSKITVGLPKAPQGCQTPPGGLQGLIFELCWSFLGPILDLFCGSCWPNSLHDAGSVAGLGR